MYVVFFPLQYLSSFYKQGSMIAKWLFCQLNFYLAYFLYVFYLIIKLTCNILNFIQLYVMVYKIDRVEIKLSRLNIHSTNWNNRNIICILSNS
jgi:hypothetical protein